MAATTSSTPPALAAYLRRATWGLPKARQQELWDELEEHVLERADHLCAFGTPYTQALRQAITDLGPPARVSAGMSEVYLMPKLIRAGLIAVVSGALAAFALGGGLQAIVDITYGGPRKLCAACATLPADQNLVAWINLDTIEKTLPKQGVKVFRQPKQTVLEFPGIAQKVRLPLSEWFSSRDQRYTPTWQLIWGFMGTNQARMSGFDNPTLTLGTVSLVLGNEKEMLSGYTAYEPVVGQAVAKFMRASTAGGVNQPADVSVRLVSRTAGGMPVENKAMRAHRIATSADPGDVLVLLTRTESGILFYDLAPVGPDRSLTVYVARPNLRFVSSAADLSPYLSGNRANAVLLKLNGKLSTLTTDSMAEVIQPTSPTSDAR